MTAAEVVVGLAAGLVAGTFAGLLGIGGGLVIVPAMVVLLDQSQHVAQGTSLLVIVPTAIVGSIANARAGILDRKPAAMLALGGLAGGAAGSAIALNAVGESTLRRAFGVLVIAMGLRLASTAWTRRSEVPEGSR